MKQQTITLNKSQGENSTTQEIKLIYPGLTSKILQSLQQQYSNKITFHSAWWIYQSEIYDVSIDKQPLHLGVTCLVVGYNYRVQIAYDKYSAFRWHTHS